MPEGQSPPTRIWARRHLPADVAADLRQARLDRGLSICRAAEEIGIDKGHLSRLERGLRAPRVATARRIIDTLDLDKGLAEALLEESVEPGWP